MNPRKFLSWIYYKQRPASPLLPIIAFLPVIRAARKYASTFWAVPYWSQIYEYFDFLMMFAGFSMACLLACFAIYMMRQRTLAKTLSVPLRPHELTAGLAFLALPIVVIAVAIFITRGFHPRYVLTPVIGIASLVAATAFQLFRGDKVFGLGLTIVLLCCFIANGWRMYNGNRTKYADIIRSVRFLEKHATGQEPIVITAVTGFYQMSFYAPRRIANRFVYLAEPPYALAYLRHDTIDRGLLDLRRWFPLGTEPYRQFMANQPDFLAFGDFNEWTWQSWQFIQDKAKLELVGRENYSVLLHGTFNKPTHPMPKTNESRAFRKALALPPDSSVCRTWTRDRLCSGFR